MQNYKIAEGQLFHVLNLGSWDYLTSSVVLNVSIFSYQSPKSCCTHDLGACWADVSRVEGRNPSLKVE